MAPVIHMATPGERARTLRELARERHVHAVRRLDGGDRDGWYGSLQDVRALEEEARRLDRQQARLDEQSRLFARALDRILDKAHAQRDAERSGA